MFSVSRFRALSFGLALAAATGAVMPQGALTVAHAADDLESTALGIAPVDVAFFSTSVNMDDAWRELAEGKFVARVRAVPFVQKLEAEFWQQWESPQGQLAQAKGMIENPNIRNVLKLAQNMFSDEVFIYGGDDWCETIDGFMFLQNELASQASAGPEAMEAYLQAFSREDADRIRIPTLVMGFRLSDDENARLQLDALEGIVRLGGSQFEEAKPFLQRLKRSDLKSGQTLAITLDTSLIPLEQLDEQQREIADKVIELLEGRSISLAMGVKDNIMLMAFGEGESVIDSVGEASEKLLSHPRMQVLKDAAPERLRSVNYTSQRFRDAQWDANFGGYFQRLAGQFSMALAAETEGQENEWRNDLLADAAEMDGLIQRASPEFDAMLAWTVATDDGCEGYTYDWSEQVFVENGAPLKVTQHAGDTPLLFYTLKQQDHPIAAELMEFVFANAPEHIRKFIALAEDDEEERERVWNIVDIALPIARDMYDVIHDKLVPSLAGNESSLSIAAGWSTNTLGPNLPPPSRALPLPEIGGASLLADRDLFLQGCDELYGHFDRIVDAIREANPDSVAENYTVPRPREEALDGAVRYSYAEFDNALPIAGFSPQLIVGDDVMVYGYSKRQVEDLLDAKPLVTRPAWMTDETPTAAVSYADFAGMVTAVRPWIEYGLSFTGQPLSEPLSPAPGPIPTGNDVLQIWDCFTSLGKSAATVVVDEAGQPTVVRWVWVTE